MTSTLSDIFSSLSLRDATREGDAPTNKGGGQTNSKGNASNTIRNHHQRYNHAPHNYFSKQTSTKNAAIATNNDKPYNQGRNRNKNNKQRIKVPTVTMKAEKAFLHFINAANMVWFAHLKYDNASTLQLPDIVRKMRQEETAPVAPTVKLSSRPDYRIERKQRKIILYGFSFYSSDEDSESDYEIAPSSLPIANRVVEGQGYFGQSHYDLTLHDRRRLEDYKGRIASNEVLVPLNVIDKLIRVRAKIGKFTKLSKVCQALCIEREEEAAFIHANRFLCEQFTKPS